MPFGFAVAARARSSRAEASWAGTKAADEGADWLRVDVWTTNERLQHYDLKQGFSYVRTIVLAHNPSGALSNDQPSTSQPHT